MTVHTILFDHDTDPSGNPMDLVVFTNRTAEYMYRTESVRWLFN